MAVLREERSRIFSDLHTRKPAVDAAGQPRHGEGWRPSLLTWLTTAGEFILGLVPTLVGLLVRGVVAVSLLAAPFIALILMVFFSALMIEGTGLILRTVGLTH